MILLWKLVRKNKNPHCHRLRGFLCGPTSPRRMVHKYSVIIGFVRLKGSEKKHPLLNCKGCLGWSHLSPKGGCIYTDNQQVNLFRWFGIRTIVVSVPNLFKKQDFFTLTLVRVPFGPFLFC